MRLIDWRKTAEQPLPRGVGMGRRLLRTLAAACLINAMATASLLATDIDDAGIAMCDIGAWSTDKDPGGLNIRAEPGTDSPVIGKIPPPVENEGDLFANEVTITGSKDGWLRISKAEFVDYYWDADKTHFEGEGWVSGRYLGFSVEGSVLLRAPSPASPVAVDFSQKRSGGEADSDYFNLERLHACRGYWVEIEGTFRGRRVRGWTTDICSNQVTTCP